MHLLFSMSVQIQHLHALPISHPTGGGGAPVGRTNVGDDSSLHPLPLAGLIGPTRGSSPALDRTSQQCLRAIIASGYLRSPHHGVLVLS